MLKTGIWMIVGGGLLIAIALNEAKQSSAGKKEPQEITCAELVDEGFGDNAHVRMTDFYLCEDEYVYEEKILWTGAWVPAVPRGSSIHETMLARAEGRSAPPALPGQEIRIIVSLPEARSEKDVERAAKSEHIQGLIIRPQQLIDRKNERLLEESYPGLDFKECMILVKGRRPSSRTKTISLTGSGIALMVIGGTLLVLHWRKQRKDSWIIVDKR